MSDRTRIVVAQVVIASLAVAWLAANAVSASPPTWLALVASCLGIALSPAFAGAASRRVALQVAGLAAATFATPILLAQATGLVLLAPLTLITAALAALMGVGGALLAQRGDAAQRTVRAEATTAIAARAGADTAAPRSPAPAAAAARAAVVFEPGARLGRYTLQSRLAVGGMGEVWRASHDTLIRPAVLKIIRRPPVEDRQREAEWIERFRREAMVTASLTSPHTVHLYDFGVEGESSLYIAMELLEAMSLRAIVERFGPMEEARVAFLLRQACHSLIEAHEGGVVHRDLKPDNLLVTRAGHDTDFLKVIDFGLVKQFADGSRKGRPLTGRQAHMQLTALGARPGTPGYMAPEQIDGSVVDPRSDIYALACVAYFALTGLPVFEGTEDAQLMFVHMEVDPDPPSLRMGKPLHAGLEALVMRCLAKNPAERPESMAALDDALAALSFERPWSQARARQWWSDERMRFRTRASRDSVV